jgi:aminomethyltransferase
MTVATLQQTALHDWHVEHGGKMVDFAGWSMPIQYGSIVDEHVATRTAVTLFDVSHMGRLRFHGAAAAGFLDGMVTRRIADMQDGQIRYGLMTNHEGGILDDVLVYRLAEPGGTSHFSMVVNASNRGKILAWLHAQQPAHVGMTIEDLTTVTCMIAVQGPSSIKLVQPLLDCDLAGLAYYRGCYCRFDHIPITCSRTGYTGEDGCELVVPAAKARSIWETLMRGGAGLGIRAAGLGARDTLRLEAAMPLYGHELREDINPVQVGLDFAVNLKDHTFIGRTAIVAAKKNDASLSHRVGLRLEGKRVPREGYSIYAASEQIGVVTSGTYSPTLDYPIAMGYVPRRYAVPRTVLHVDLRGRRIPAMLVELPFYRRSA